MQYINGSTHRRVKVGLAKPQFFIRTKSVEPYSAGLAGAVKHNNLSDLAAEDIGSLIHDFRRYQIEAELQDREMLRANSGLEQTHQKYSDLYQFAPVGYFTINTRGLVEEVNLTGLRLLMYDYFSLVNRPFSSIVYPEDENIFIEHKRLVLEGPATHACELRLVRRDGSAFDARMESVAVIVAPGGYSYRTVVSDISEHKRMEEQLLLLSVTDELTGLYNRRGFFTLAEQQFKVSSRSEKGMVLISVDMDNLKDINDTFGHSEGDMALTETADILRKSFRESDIVARIGGDEFLVLLTAADDISREVAGVRLQKCLDIRNARGNSGYALSFSFGTSCYSPKCPCSLHELLVEADKSMYRDKKRKKGLSL